MSKQREDPECPNLVLQDVGVELPVCRLNGKYCIREQGYDCTVYEGFLDEGEYEDDEERED